MWYPPAVPIECTRLARPAPRSRKPPHSRGFSSKRMKGFEPSTFAMARRRSSQLSYIREAGSTLAARVQRPSLGRSSAFVVERPASPNGSSRSRTAARNPSSAAQALKRVALARVPGDAVEDRAEDLGGMKALCEERLVDQQLHHRSWLRARARSAPTQSLRPLPQPLGRRSLDREAPLRGLAARQSVAGEQQPRGALRRRRGKPTARSSGTPRPAPADSRSSRPRRSPAGPSRAPCPCRPPRRSRGRMQTTGLPRGTGS